MARRALPLLLLLAATCAGQEAEVDPQALERGAKLLAKGRKVDAGQAGERLFHLVPDRANPVSGWWALRVEPRPADGRYAVVRETMEAVYAQTTTVQRSRLDALLDPSLSVISLGQTSRREVKGRPAEVRSVVLVRAGDAYTLRVQEGGELREVPADPTLAAPLAPGDLALLFPRRLRDMGPGKAHALRLLDPTAAVASVAPFERGPAGAQRLAEREAPFKGYELRMTRQRAGAPERWRIVCDERGEPRLLESSAGFTLRACTRTEVDVFPDKPSTLEPRDPAAHIEGSGLVEPAAATAAPRELDRTSPVAQALAALLHVPANFGKDGRVELTYDFKREDELLDWSHSGFDKVTAKGFLEVVAGANRPAFIEHCLHMLGPYEVSFNATVRGTPDSDVVFRFGGAGARFGTQLGEAHARGFTPLTRGEPDRERLRGTVRYVIDGDEITVFVGGEQVARTDALKGKLEGRFGIWAENAVVMVSSITIKGRVDPSKL